MELLLLLCDSFRILSMFLHFCIHLTEYKFKRDQIKSNEIDIRGKCVVVTGGSRGIGKACAREFAQRGATVVIGSSNVETGERTAEQIRKDTGNEKVTFIELNFSQMDSVERFAMKVSENYPKIKILLNNAGIGVSKSENAKTKDGFNIHVAVNYLGHFLLTHLLMKNLKAETNPRVVTMTSTLLLVSQLNIRNMNMDNERFGFQNYIPYSNTKCMLALFTKELGKQHGINTYALCTGFVKTKMNFDSAIIRTLLTLLPFLTVSTDEAASSVLFCALDESLKNESGQTYRFKKLFSKANNKVDTHSAKEFYDTSAELVKLKERLAKMNK